MSRMLRDEEMTDPIVQFGARALYIGGETYDNTASKFWSSLIDEAMADYPGCDAITLATTGSVALVGDLLFPVNELQRELDKAQHIDLEEAIRQAVEDIALFGRPAAVRATLFVGNDTVRTRELPRECVDAQVFSYLVAWLLQWSDIPEAKWNDEWLSGRIDAGDPVRKLSYRIATAYHNKHLSEGLFSRSLTVRFSRRQLAG